MAYSLEDGNLLEGTEKIDFVEKDTDGNPKFEAWNWYDDEETKKIQLMPSSRFAIESISTGLKGMQPKRWLIDRMPFKIEECVVNE